MKEKNNNRSILSVLVMLCICILGGITAFAYESPQTIEGKRNSKCSFEAEFVEKDVSLETVLWDKYFVDSNGKITEIKGLNNSEKIGCRHNYSISGTYKEHKKNNKGGCTITEYDAMKCSICGSVKYGDITNVITYQTCPH